MSKCIVIVSNQTHSLCPVPTAKGEKGVDNVGAVQKTAPGHTRGLQTCLEQDARGGCPVHCCGSELGSSQVTTPARGKNGIRSYSFEQTPEHRVQREGIEQLSWAHGRFFKSQSWFQDFTWQFYSGPLCFDQQLPSSFAEHKRIRIYYFISPFVWHPSRCSFIAQQAPGHARSFSPAMAVGALSWRKGKKNL